MALAADASVWVRIRWVFNAATFVLIRMRVSFSLKCSGSILAPFAAIDRPTTIHIGGGAGNFRAP